MRKIYVGFSKSTKFFPIYSWAIRAIEGTKFSHVYVRHETKYGVDIVYQASGTQVNFMNEELFFKKSDVVREFQFEVTNDAFDTYMRFAMKNAGKPYGILQAIGIAIYSLFGLKNNPFPSGQAAYVCSELVAEILFEIGKFKYDRELFDKLTPKDLFKFCLKHSGEEATNDFSNN